MLELVPAREELARVLEEQAPVREVLAPVREALAQVRVRGPVREWSVWVPAQVPVPPLQVRVLRVFLQQPGPRASTALDREWALSRTGHPW